MKRLAAIAGLFLSLCPLGAKAQTFQCSASFFYYGAVPSQATWSACFASLQASLGYAPLNRAGDTMLGPLGITHLFGASGTPAVAAGAGAGTSPTVTVVNAYDSDFALSVVTGSSPTGSNAIIATVTFSVAYTGTVPHCTFSPLNANAAALGSAATPFSNFTSGPPYPSWNLKSGSTALTAATTYLWDVICVG